MKKLTIYPSILFWATVSFSQSFVLQHHFIEGNATLIDLDVSGKKYMNH
ncbi:MAG: hypothetical protein IR153_03960 [Flavobacterium sp.]|nr:hypothetical protein [Flavobacterium sp.]